MNKSLMTIVLESLAFWELGSDDVVDPEAAQEQLEGAAKALQDLAPEERKEFLQFAREYADEEEDEGGPEERTEFFRGPRRDVRAGGVGGVCVG
ncbi:MAG: hypothetical protein WDO13_01580 [Verrucomicrobiota bacterium]